MAVKFVSYVAKKKDNNNIQGILNYEDVTDDPESLVVAYLRLKGLVPEDYTLSYLKTALADQSGATTDLETFIGVAVSTLKEDVSINWI